MLVTAIYTHTISKIHFKRRMREMGLVRWLGDLSVTPEAM